MRFLVAFRLLFSSWNRSPLLLVVLEANNSISPSVDLASKEYVVRPVGGINNAQLATTEEFIKTAGSPRKFTPSAHPCSLSAPSKAAMLPPENENGNRQL